MRIDVGAKNISKTDFDLEIKTWGETSIWGAAVNYIAIDPEFASRSGKLQKKGTI